MKEINDYLPYFPPGKAIGTPRVTLTVFLDYELKDTIDTDLSQASNDVCKRNEYNVLGHLISNAWTIYKMWKVLTQSLHVAPTATEVEEVQRKAMARAKAKGSPIRKMSSLLKMALHDRR